MMNLQEIARIAKYHAPDIQVDVIAGRLRHDVVGELKGEDNIGIELGVAKGIYAKRLVASGKFNQLFGVDVYGDLHDTNEYKSTLKYIGLDAPYHLLRMPFEAAKDIFDDNYFDFIYVDGYAHNGEEGGRTLIDWYRKLKVGGILAGDDYHDDWPLVKWAVNDFVKKSGTELKMTGGRENADYCLYPSWYLVKKDNRVIEPNPLLVKLSDYESARIFNERMKLSQGNALPLDNDFIRQELMRLAQSVPAENDSRPVTLPVKNKVFFNF